MEKSFNEGQEIMFFQSKNTQGTTAPNIELQKILSQLLMSTDIITIQYLIIVDTNSDQNIPDLRIGALLDKVLLKQKKINHKRQL